MVLVLLFSVLGRFYHSHDDVHHVFLASIRSPELCRCEALLEAHGKDLHSAADTALSKVPSFKWPVGSAGKYSSAACVEVLSYDGGLNNY